jgi:hypothetical protein
LPATQGQRWKDVVTLTETIMAAIRSDHRGDALVIDFAQKL